MNDRSVKALVIGAGIGGLATAIALRRTGIRAEVYEQAPELRAVGAGLTLWPNATAALETIGVADAVRSLAVPVVTGMVRDNRGQILQRESDALLRKYPGLLLAIHRAELQAALLGALDPEAVILGARCTSFEEVDGQVRVHFADGREACGNLLVGADGLHSVVRAQLWGAKRPVYAGYTAWRGVAAFGDVPAGEWWGCGARFGLLPLAGDHVYWFATANLPEGASDAPSGRRSELLARFRGWPAPISNVVAATDEAAILRNDLYDRPALPRWGRGPVTLLGDAAHPMTPNLGQGACQAIEDAALLASALAGRQCQDLVAGLRGYEAARIPRTRAITVQSQRIGRVAQWQNPVNCILRNTLLRLVPEVLLAHQLAWILDYRV